MLKLKINLNNAYGEDEPITTDTLNEFDAHLKKANVNFTRKGRVITYTGTETQLLEAAFQEYQFFCSGGPSFSEEEALDYIRECAT